MLQAGAARAEGDGGALWALPRGAEKDVQEFIRPLILGQRVATGDNLDSLAIQSDRMVLGFRRPDGSMAFIEVLHPENAPDSPPAGPVVLAPKGEVPAALLAVVRSAFADHPHSRTPWMRARDTGVRVLDLKSPWQTLRDPQLPLIPVCLLLLLVLVIASALSIRGSLQTAPAATFVALTALGFALRLMLSPRTFLHEYDHVADTLNDYLFGGTGAALYGATGPALYRLAQALFGGDERTVFMTNLVLASLTVPAVAVLAWFILRDWTSAIVCGVLLAILPLHLRFSASEDLSIPGVAFAVWGVAASLAYIDRRRWSDLLAASCALVLCFETRPEMLLVPLVPLTYLVLTRPVATWKGLFGWPALIAVVVTGVLWGQRFLFLRQVNLESEHGASLPVGLAQLKLIAFFDGDLVPRPLLLLVVTGLLALVWKGRARMAVWLMTMAALFIAFPLRSFQNPPPFNLRTQLFSFPLLLIVCSATMLLFSSRRAWAGALVVGVVALVGVISCRAALAATADQQQEWAFIRDTAPDLPGDSGKLMTLSGGDLAGAGAHHRKIDLFPEFVLRREHKKLIPIDLDQLTWSGDWPAPSHGLYYYEGMYCYFVLESDPSPTIDRQPRCQAVRDRYVLKPVATRTIPGPGYSPLRYRAPPYEIGFYEVVGLKAAGQPVPATADLQVAPVH